MVNESIFKSYDVRGIYPKELNEEAAYVIGKAFIACTQAKNVVVGYDARISSPLLFNALLRGLFAAGADIYSIGQVPTEGLYFAVGKYDFDAGIMITASHNPKEYNGFKMMKKEGGNIVWVRGKDLFGMVKSDGLSVDSNTKVIPKDIWPDYLKFMDSFFDKKNIKPFSVVIDVSNGVFGDVISKFKHELPIKITDLNFKADGHFPAHGPNPLAPGASLQIADQIQKQKADFGFMFDGDADRIFLVDENGQLVKGDAILLLLAKHFLKKNPGAAIAYNAICSKAVPEFVTKWGGTPVRTPVGFVNVREGLIKNSGVMGGELSCHYCFRDYFYMDSGMIAFLTLLQIISQDGRKVSEIVAEFSPYAKTAEINFEIKDKDAMLKNIKATYADGKQDFLDGITVEYKDWWFNVRPSNTEPLLRLTIEADTQELLAEKQKELSDLLVK